MAVSEHYSHHFVITFGRPILLSIDFLEHRCYNVLCCGMLPQVHGCLDVGPFVCILLGSSLPAGACCQHFGYHFSIYNLSLHLPHFFLHLSSRGESGWCSDVTSTHGAWRHAGVRFLLSGERICKLTCAVAHSNP